MYLSILLFSPLIACFIILLLKKKRLIRWMAVVGTTPSLILSLFLYIFYMREGSLQSFSEFRTWIFLGVDQPFSLPFQLGVDGLSVIMILFTSILAFLSAIASVYVKQHVKGFYTLLFILQFGMLGVFLADNLFLFFIFLEITLIPMFFLIGNWGEGEKRKTSFYYLLYNGLGSLLLLMAFVYLFSKTGTTSISELQKMIPTLSTVTNVEKTVLFTVFLIGFGIKLPIVPFHSWMIYVHQHAPSSIVMLHSGVLLKIGGYGLITFSLSFFPEQASMASSWLIGLGTINFLYGGFIALAQTNLRRMIAYSSVSHMGVVLIGIGSIHEIGVQGAVFQMISHGFITAFFFFLIVILEDRRLSLDYNSLSGMSSSMTKLASMFIVCCLASVGLPGMSGFISEFLVFTGVFNQNLLLGSIAVVGILVTVIYMVRFISVVQKGHAKQPKADLNGLELSSALLFVLMIIAIGVFPSVVSSAIAEPIELLVKGMR
ncbi:NADH-quinone oxidoreductase subunit M [Bacillus carboniphilus]|uniref:NADH-quinone oxidoreductase subunit M n=1 Tax=Bacillus carboniphilus TaxID=86663 RepID=A0ABY9JQE9_9BACI|nr:NADH-quinone oxidoreductase subunit M [Bacillus carboniphilus]WLR41631.1 NADH-quinone oxidoreductase subunit M [Bacillus carboniphilus]